MIAETYNSEIRQQVFNAVTNLLDKYYLYGFLYDRNGNLKIEYLNTYAEIKEDGSEGPLMDAEGCPVVSEKFLYENFYELPDKFQQLNPYLDVHSNVHFDQVNWTDIRYLSNEKIKKRFIGDSIKQLVAMLRRGHNYAMIRPVASAVSDEYLEDMICFVWKMMVLDTINVHDVKKKYFVPGNEYYKKGEKQNYDWDTRPYHERITDVEDIVAHKNGNLTIKFNTNKNYNKTAEELDMETKNQESQMLRVITCSLRRSDRELSIANKVQEQVDKASQNFPEISSAEISAKEPSIAKRMESIFKIY